MFSALDDAALGARLAARTLELVDIPSPSGAEDALAAHVLGLLRAGGVEARDAGDGCVVARLAGAAGGPPVILAGHFDTVPAQGNIPGTRDDEAVHGLGASDMKGAVALIVEAALALAAGYEGLPVTAVLFPREELPPEHSALAPLLRREQELRDAALAVVMEPTAGAVQAGCLGNVNATWTFTGRSGHSARPWLADNAIVRAARGIARLAEIEPERHSSGGLEFVEAVSVTRIAAGIADNVIPAEARCHVNYRYPPGMAPAEAESRLRGWCEADGASLSILANSPSAPAAADHPLVARLREAGGGLPLEPKQAWTPVAEFAAEGVPAVNFGPGDPRFAHRPDEQVAVASLVSAARTLERFLAAP